MLSMLSLTPWANRRVRQRRLATPKPRARARLVVELLENRLVLDRTVLDMVHAHLAVDYVNGAWSMRVEDTTNDVEYAPTDVLLYVSAQARQVQPAGWGFIGAGDGNPDWQLPEEEDPSLLTIALSTEDTAPGTFDTYRPNDPRISRLGEWMKITLRDLQGPGDISAWQDEQPPSSWWISSYDGGRTLDPVVYLEPGGHMHLNWGFTAAGIYQVTLEASAFLNGHGLPTRSDDVTFTFGVEDTGEPPPPGGGVFPFQPGLVQNGALGPARLLSPVAAPAEASLPAAPPSVPILNGQNVDRFFVSPNAAETGSQPDALGQRSAEVHSVDGIAETFGVIEFGRF